jgi:multidrug efflux pump
MLVSGMIIGTLFTLFVVPSIYVLVARTRATVPVTAPVGTEAPGPAVPDFAEAAF